MAVNQTNKRRDVVSTYVALATEIDNLMDRLAMIDASRLQSGTFDAASFTGNEHIDDTDLGNLATRFNELRAVIDAPFARDILRKARR